MSTIDQIEKLTKQLYPTGRAFKVPANSILERLHRALAQSEQRAYDDALSIKDSSLPDNDNFTTGDASDWEFRLGMITNELVLLADRKAAIQRKMAHPGDIPARQHYLYLQGQLQAADFNVFVFENRFPVYPDTFETRSPEEILGLVAHLAQYSTSLQYGQSQYGGQQTGSNWEDVIANNIDEDKDAFFNVGTNLRSTFFIGADPVGDFADVDINRKEEFRQLVLNVKPVQSIAFLFINYI